MLKYIIVIDEYNVFMKSGFIFLIDTSKFAVESKLTVPLVITKRGRVDMFIERKNLQLDQKTFPSFEFLKNLFD